MKNILLFLVMSLSTSAFADWSEVRVFYRCHQQISGLEPNVKGALFQDVKNGSKTASEACKKLLESAMFDAKTDQLEVRNNVTLAVLQNFQTLHQSWFASKDVLEAVGAKRYQMVKDIVDAGTPAMYFVRALFHPEKGVNSILASRHLMAKRTNNNPAKGVLTGLTKSETAFTNLKFAPFGKLLGVKESGNLTFATDGGNASFGKTFGGGAIGTPTYFHMADAELSPANGGLEMPRVWARNVFSDFLCRELPVIRPEDGVKFVSANSPVPFRQSAPCVQCHASMDRAAAVIRNFSYKTIGGTRAPDIGAIELISRPSTLPPGNLWPAKPDAQYSKRAPVGTLYFRDYTGKLVNVKVNGIREFAAAIMDTDDFYICAAKRYYEYFTGIRVDVSDPQGRTFAEPMASYRDTVINLGKNLRGHRNLQTTIEEILNTNEYRGE